MRNVKIVGAGSIGNHLAHAARVMGWGVVVCDVSDEALDRMRSSIYPERYGSWDEAIELHNCASAPRGGFDAIFIGTPPDHHLPVALDAITEEPAVLVIEKPVCPPSLELAQTLYEKWTRGSTDVLVGYDHVVGQATKSVEAMLAAGAIGEIETLDVEFREHWGGIFDAHPWLSGPEDSYLGSWERGGGASGEHSHALNLWQHFSHIIDAGRVKAVNAMLEYVPCGESSYDSLCLLDLITERGLVGRVVQDVVTRPSRKRARIQGTEGAIEWVCQYSPEGDAVILDRPGRPQDLNLVKKTRVDDFLEEMKTVEGRLSGDRGESPLGLDRGLDTMLVVAAAHRSEHENRRMFIDYELGYVAEAVSEQDTLKGVMS